MSKALYPDPPEYYKLYTERNKQLDIPELQPPVPIQGEFTVFGQTDNVRKGQINFIVSWILSLLPLKNWEFLHFLQLNH
jgi:hypothetical protein